VTPYILLALACLVVGAAIGLVAGCLASAAKLADLERELARARRDARIEHIVAHMEGVESERKARAAVAAARAALVLGEASHG
jgi:hypothetical protein